MPYSGELKTTFKALKIAKVAIVDDAYDQPDFEAFAKAGLAAVRNALQDLSDRLEEGEISTLPAELKTRSGLDLEDALAGLRDGKHIDALWHAYVDAEPGSELRALLAGYEALSADKRDKLRPLRCLKELLLRDAGVAEVVELDSATTAEMVVGYDMVFLDFYLSDEVPSKPDATLSEQKKSNARKRSIDFLKKLVEANTDAVPLVMLISSMATAEDLPEFRDGAKMFASRMSFLPKDLAEGDAVRAQHTILSLAKHKPNSDALVELSSAWKKAVEEASEQLLVSLRKLDLPDYSYLNQYRLSTERIPLPHYLAWLFSGALTDGVERKLQSGGVAQVAAKLKLPDIIPGRVAPTLEITSLYNSLTTTSIRVGEDGFRPAAWSGDIFIATAKYNEIFGTDQKVLKSRKALPEVLAVVTPSCDLVPEREKVATITMIGGELKPLSEADHKSNMLIMLNSKPYVVEWNAKWPVTIGRHAMGSKSSMASRYQWVTRLRDLYHADLQHKLMTDLSRVGLNVPPPMPETVAVKVLAKTGAGDDGYTELYQADHKEGAAWAFAGTNGDRTFCLREEVVWLVRDRLRKVEDGNAAKLKELREKADDPNFVKNLQDPVALKKDKADRNSGVTVRYRRAQTLDEVSGKGEQHPLVVTFAA